MKPFPTDWARSAISSAARSVILRGGFAPLLAAKLDIHVEGREGLADLEPPALFVANHTSHLDAPLVLTSLPPAWREKIAVGAAADHFFDVWWRAAATALAFNAFPVERGPRGRQRGLGRRLLSEGYSLLVFPEATRSRDGIMAGFGEGAAALAAAAGAPIVPIAIRGAYQAMPADKSWPDGGRPRVSLRFGKPCRAAPGESATAFSRRVQAQLALMLEEEQTTWWSALRRGAKPAETTRIGPPRARWRRVWESSEPLAKSTDPWSGSPASGTTDGSSGEPAREEPGGSRPRLR